MYVQQSYSPEAAYARYNNKTGVPHVLSVVHDSLAIPILSFQEFGRSLEGRGEGVNKHIYLNPPLIYQPGQRGGSL